MQMHEFRIGFQLADRLCPESGLARLSSGITVSHHVLAATNKRIWVCDPPFETAGGRAACPPQSPASAPSRTTSAPAGAGSSLRAQRGWGPDSCDGQDVGPHGNHPEEQSNRRQRGRLFNNSAKHHNLPKRTKAEHSSAFVLLSSGVKNIRKRLKIRTKR